MEPSRYILGISAHFHDSAACLLKDGDVIAAASEERFTRHKHDASFPINAINYCLRYTGVGAGSIDKYVFYENPYEKARRIIQTIEEQDADDLSNLIQDFARYASTKMSICETIANKIYELYGVKVERSRISYTNHHISHASSAFYPSGYKDAAILCVDGVGEFDTITSWVGHGTKIEKIGAITYPHSLGMLYSSVTSYLGFKPNTGEYKVMGLAPYGAPIFAKRLRKALTTGAGFEFRLKRLLSNSFVRKQSSHALFEKILGVEARSESAPIDAFHCDVASSVQQLLEKVLLELASGIWAKTNQNNLCLAGGVALNCVGAAAIRDSGIFTNVWVQPASSDAGGAMGAALYAYYMQASSRQEPVLPSPYLGPEIDDSIANAALNSEALNAHRHEDIVMARIVARRLASGDVVAIARGRMEFGPRALGNRSILADPRKYEMKLHLNSVVKKRESFRPFAPVVLEESADTWFQDATRSPLMTFSFKAKGDASDEIIISEFGRVYKIRSAFPAATHVDQTCRIQTVSKQQNEFLYQIIVEFEAITGIPVILNTSFNGKNEPIVCSEIDAINCFKSNSIDVLVLGNWLVTRSENIEK